MSSATKIVHGMWEMLRLEIPPKRRPQLARYLAGFKPMHPSAYGSLLRAVTRALLEAGYVGVTRDSPRDPVELIAAALEVCIDQWERGTSHICNDIAIRIAAFERLYGVRARDDRLEALVQALGSGVLGPGNEPFVLVIRHAREEVAVLSSKFTHPDAILAEAVIVGRCTADAAVLAASKPIALPLARVAVLARAGRFSDALDVCEAILDRVPGHALALEQAARSAVQCGATADAAVYARRASGLIQARRTVR